MGQRDWVARSTLPSELLSREAEQEALEVMSGCEDERHLLHEMGVYLEISLYDPHGWALDAPSN
jgi:hypothetical protein